MKTVLVLINGYGMASKDSYDIDPKGELVPNLNNIASKYIYEPIETHVSNFRDGVRNFCLNLDQMYNYSIYDEVINEENAKDNPFFKQIKADIDSRNGKTHVFMFVDNSEKIVEQFNLFLNEINKEKKKKVFVHVVLTSNNFEDYKAIIQILSKLNISFEGKAEIGMVVGFSTLANSCPVPDVNYFFKIFISEVAEKWTSFTQKLEVSQTLKQAPNQLKAFVVNSGFGLEKDDRVIFWNYDRIDLKNFITNLRNIKYGTEPNRFTFYSLFEVVCSEKIPFHLNTKPCPSSLSANLAKMGSSALVITKKNDINIFNYFANGCQNVVSQNVKFIEGDNYLFKPTDLLNIINSYQEELMIITYTIESAKTVEELQTLIHNIDIMIGNIYENSQGSKYSMIVSSLYGMNKTLSNAKQEICTLNFTGRVPFIYVDDFVTRRDYLVRAGSITDLGPTCYKAIKKELNFDSLVSKKSGIYKLFFK